MGQSKSAENLRKDLRLQFDGLYVFGDSYSDYGSRAADDQRRLFEPDASPAWSGVTFSNGQINWQTLLSKTLGITPSKIKNQENLPASPYFLYANQFVSPPDLAAQTQSGTSYAVGGATTGIATLYQFTIPEQATQLQLDNLGVAAQISTALGEQNVRIDSDHLAVVWAGGNDLLAAFATEQPLDASLNNLISQLRNDLETVLRFGDARQAILSAVSPIRGEVNGVPYQAPFLSGILLAGNQPNAPAWLKEWVEQIDAGIIDEFRANVQTMVADVQKAFPYANLINFNPEYQAQYNKFGKRLGDFSSYGISDTLSFAQNSSNSTTLPTPDYLYFDEIHVTSSGHRMLGKAIELELNAASKRTAKATLTNTIKSSARIVRGTSQNDFIIGKSDNQILRGLRGNDLLIGRGKNELIDGGVGNDILEGRGANERLRGGLGADFFRFTEADTEPGEIDQILDFTPSQGDRLGINAVLGITNSLSGGEWIYIGSNSFNGIPGELRFKDGLLQGDLNGDGSPNLQIQLDGINVFDTSWIS
jgi:phospholipase/lecithinase/hemolysin